MYSIDAVLQELDKLHISYRLCRHPAVFTMEEMNKLDLHKQGCIVKNLFLRNANGKQHFLVVIKEDKKADLKDLRTQLGCTPLSFASEERLEKYLHLTKGSVTPLGILSDESREVCVVFDRDLEGEKNVGVHPCDNRATVFLSFADLKKLMETHGNETRFVEL